MKFVQGKKSSAPLVSDFVDYACRNVTDDRKSRQKKRVLIDDVSKHAAVK